MVQLSCYFDCFNEFAEAFGMIANLEKIEFFGWSIYDRATIDITTGKTIT